MPDRWCDVGRLPRRHGSWTTDDNVAEQPERLDRLDRLDRGLDAALLELEHAVTDLELLTVGPAHPLGDGLTAEA